MPLPLTNTHSLARSLCLPSPFPLRTLTGPLVCKRRLLADREEHGGPREPSCPLHGPARCGRGVVVRYLVSHHELLPRALRPLCVCACAFRQRRRRVGRLDWREQRNWQRCVHTKLIRMSVLSIKICDSLVIDIARPVFISIRPVLSSKKWRCSTPRHHPRVFVGRKRDVDQSPDSAQRCGGLPLPLCPRALLPLCPSAPPCRPLNFLHLDATIIPLPPRLPLNFEQEYRPKMWISM